MNWIPAILAIGVLIVVHEAGHYIVARLCSMRVEKFSIGFGPALAKWKSPKTGTQFQLAPIPFGGFVEIKGMNILEEVDPNDASAYPNRPAWQRFLTIFAGPATNYVFAVFLAFGVFLFAGMKSSDPPIEVDTVDSSGVYAIADGALRGWNGKQWAAAEIPDAPKLGSVWAKDFQIFAVGDAGAAVHYDAGKWSAVETGTTASLRDVWGANKNDVFAVGDAGTIVHWDGKAWLAQPSGTKETLRDVWGVSSSDVYAVGDAGTIVHWDGKTWSAMPSGTTARLLGVSERFAVGDAGTILARDGVAWTPMPSGTTRTLTSVWGDFVVGAAGTILRWDGAAWTPMDSGTDVDLASVYGRSADVVFAAGAKGTLLRWEGDAWAPMASDTDKDLATVWSVPGWSAEGKLLPGDKFVGVDGKKLTGALGPAVKAVGDRDAVFQVERVVDGKTTVVDVTLRPRYQEPEASGQEGTWRLGVLLRERGRVDVGVGTAAKEAAIYPVVMTKKILVGLKEWVTGETEGRMSSVVGIGQVVKQAIDESWVIALELLMVLNVYLGLFNLFPLPALDGGRLVFLGYEMVTRRRANPKLEATVHMVGVLVLAVLLVVVTVNDCRHL